MGTQYATLNARRLCRLYLAIGFPSVPGLFPEPMAVIGLTNNQITNGYFN